MFRRVTAAASPACAWQHDHQQPWLLKMKTACALLCHVLSYSISTTSCQHVMSRRDMSCLMVWYAETPPSVLEPQAINREQLN